MTTLVSINPSENVARLRRYETGRGGRPACTHDGVYDPPGVTAMNVESYRIAGAAQDLVGRPVFGARRAGRLTR